MKNLKKERNIVIDGIKAVTIFLVALGHAIQFNRVNDFESNSLFRIIYSFHMPLFMIVSGYLSYNNKKWNFTYIKRKFCELVIPFLVWYFTISYLMTYVRSKKFMGIKEYIYNLIVNPSYGLWFLWILFLNILMFYIVIVIFNLSHNKFISLVPVILIYLIPVDILGINLFKWYFVFYACGYFIAKYKQKILEYENIAVMVSIIIYFLLFRYWIRDGEPTFVYTLMSINFFRYNKIFIDIVSLIFNYAIAFSGIIITYFFVKNILRINILNKFIFIGKYTKDIYIIHFYFIFLVHRILPAIGENFLGLLIITLGAIIFSLIISLFILRKNKFTKLIFLGYL